MHSSPHIITFLRQCVKSILLTNFKYEIQCNYSHHVVHYSITTYFSYNWKFIPFEQPLPTALNLIACYSCINPESTTVIVLRKLWGSSEMSATCQLLPSYKCWGLYSNTYPLTQKIPCSISTSPQGTLIPLGLFYLAPRYTFHIWTDFTKKWSNGFNQLCLFLQVVTQRISLRCLPFELFKYVWGYRINSIISFLFVLQIKNPQFLYLWPFISHNLSFA